MCRSDSTQHIIISRWSSLVRLGFYLSSCLPTMSTLWPNDCQVSWKQCVATNTVWRSEDKVFKMHSTGFDRIARFIHDKHWISLKLHEPRNLQYIFHMITNHLFMYTEALGNVHAYVNAAMASCNYVQPTPTSSKSIIYRQLFDELKSHVY